jgi:hypothetical protein
MTGSDQNVARRRHLLLTMLAGTRFRYPPDQVPELVHLLRGWFSRAEDR